MIRKILLPLAILAAVLTVLWAQHPPGVENESAPMPAAASSEMAPHITLFARSDTTGPSMVELCHMIRPTLGRVIRVSGRAVDAHLSHGDTLTFRRIGRNECLPR